MKHMKYTNVCNIMGLTGETKSGVSWRVDNYGSVEFAYYDYECKQEINIDELLEIAEMAKEFLSKEKSTNE